MLFQKLNSLCSGNFPGFPSPNFFTQVTWNLWKNHLLWHLLHMILQTLKLMSKLLQQKME